MGRNNSFLTCPIALCLTVYIVRGVCVCIGGVFVKPRSAPYQGHNGSFPFPSADLCLRVLSYRVQPIVLTPSKWRTYRDQALHHGLGRAVGGAGSGLDTQFKGYIVM